MSVDIRDGVAVEQLQIFGLHTNESQCAVVLNHMQEHGSITALHAMRMYGCARLAARIHNLRADGHRIRSSMVSINGKRFAMYELEQA